MELGISDERQIWVEPGFQGGRADQFQGATKLWRKDTGITEYSISIQQELERSLPEAIKYICDGLGIRSIWVMIGGWDREHS